jgi:hypothetical protein
MPVLRQVPRAEAKAEVVLRYYDRLFGEARSGGEPGTATGTPGDWWTVFALAPGHLPARGRRLRRLPPSGPQDRPGAARARPDPRRLGEGQPVRLLPALQVAARPRRVGRKDRRRARHWTVSDVFDERERAVLAYADCLARPAAGSPRQVFDKLKTLLERRADLRVHLHHLPLRHARGDEPGRCASSSTTDPIRSSRWPAPESSRAPTFGAS